jgi:hypothetical protein
MGMLSCVEWLGWGCSVLHGGWHDFAISRLDLPEASYRISLPSNERAQGMLGARCTRGLVCKMCKKRAHEHTGSAEASDIPRAMVLRLTSCSCVCKICQNVRTGGSRKTARRWI